MQLGRVLKEFEQPAPEPLHEPVPTAVPVEPNPAQPAVPA